MGRMIRVWCTVLVAAALCHSAHLRASEANVEDAMRNRPLLVARQNLLVARSVVVEHRYSEAIPRLLVSAQALAFFEAQEIGRYDGIGGEAGDIRQQILDYANGIATDNHNALSNIDAWLSQIGQWDQSRKHN
jgi:hypothetical protein